MLKVALELLSAGKKEEAAQAITVALGPTCRSRRASPPASWRCCVQQTNLAKTIFSLALQEDPKHPRALLGAAQASLLGRDWERPASRSGMRATWRRKNSARRWPPRSTTSAASRACNSVVRRIGIDLGGTKIEGLALADDGRELDRRRIAAPRGNYDDTIRAIADLVRRSKRRSPKR